MQAQKRIATQGVVTSFLEVATPKFIIKTMAVLDKIYEL
jgi:hypothetical protein